MKHLILIASLLATPAWAVKGGEGNNTDCNGVGNSNSPCAPSGGSSSVGDIKNDNTNTAVGVGVGIGTGGNAASSAVGQGGSAAGGNATGGAGGSATGGTSYSALSNDIGYNNSMRSITFAAPAWTVVPTAAGCVVSTSTAWSAVFGLASYSGSKQASDAVCTMVNMAAAAQNACQYRTAATINRRVFETLTGASGEFFEKNAPQDLGPVDCALLVRFAR